jgi:hypothetical protein
MPTLAAPLDCAKLETRNERVHQLSAAPGAPVTGQQYYNTVDNTFYWWNGTAWRSADASAGAGGPPTGAAGGDLTGSTYPNPIIAPLVVTDAKVAAANKDGIAATPSMRTLGTGAQQACGGADARLSDGRAPTGAATGDLSGTYPAPQIATGVIVLADCNAALIDQVAATASLRTLGLTGNKAMPGVTTLDLIPLAALDVNLNSKKITGLATPVSGTDAANKAYVDAAAQGLDVKPSCRVASVLLTNIPIASPGATIDGVTMVVGDRVLVKENSSNIENGIYVWNGAAVPMTRSTDADTSAEVTPGMFTFIEEGGTNADSGWILTTNAPISLGSTGLVFSQFSGAGQINAGTGLTKSGNTIDAIGTAGRISVAADSIDIDATYAGQASIVTLGNVTTGTWGATTIAINKGGTGAATATNARINLGIPYYLSVLGPPSSSTTITVLGTAYGGTGRGALVQCQVESTGAVVLPDISVATNGDITINFGVAQATNTIRTTIIGLNSGAPPA